MVITLEIYFFASSGAREELLLCKWTVGWSWKENIVNIFT
jgi:hypothetical protein